jgi:16S rRNA G966 N2-methylase RsmD
MVAELRRNLISLCESALTKIVLDPEVRILGVDVEEISSSRFDLESLRKSYIVTIRTNDASMVRGKARSLKGSYKERIEAILDNRAKELDSQSGVFVEILGPESSNVERLVPIADMIRARKLTENSPIVRAAKENAIPYIQIRGRHLIAPSPAIASFLSSFGSAHRENIKTVLDLFAGTAVATKVLCRVANPEKIVVLDNDAAKIENCKRHITDKRVEVVRGDAMNYKFSEQVDLVVADPYYEDVEEFLSRQLKAMARVARILLLVPGNVEDRAWNGRMTNILESTDYRTMQHALFGQVILEAHSSTSASLPGSCKSE